MRHWVRWVLVGVAVLCGALAVTVGAYAVNQVDGGYRDLVTSRDFWVALVLAVLATAFAVAQGRAERSAIGGSAVPKYAPAIAPRLDAAGRGVRQASHDGDFFTGRRRALAEIGAWLSDRAGPRALVVTGPAGTGKSAVVGHVAQRAAAGRPIGDASVWSGRVVTIDAAAYSLLDVAQVVAKQVAGVSIEAAHELDGAVRDQRGEASDQVLVVVDGVDEAPAHAAGKLAREVLHRLASMEVRFGVRLLVGTRPEHHGDDLVRPVSRAVVVDLSDEKYFDVRDVVRYAKRLLQQDRDGNPYLDDDVATPVAETIAEGAKRVFLVAAIVAYDLGRNSTRPIDPMTLRMPADLDTALSDYVDRCGNLATLRAKDALKPLAYAEPPGMPATIWAAALSRMTGQRVDPQQLAEYARNVIGDYLVTHTDPAGGGQVTFRMFHQALNDTLAAQDPDDRVRDHAAITKALLAEGETHGWDRAAPYLLRSLAFHAAAGNRDGDLLALLDTSDYLLHADLPHLQAALEASSGADARAYRALLGTTRHAAALPAAERAAAFSVSAALRTDTAFQRRFAALAQQHHASYHATWARVRGATTVNHILEGHVAGVRAVGALPDGRVVSGGFATELQVRDLTGNAEPLTLNGHTSFVTSVAVLPDGRIASGSWDTTVRVWSLADESEPQALTGHTRWVNAVAALLDGRIASASDDGTVRVWDLTDPTGSLTLEGHTGGVLSVAGLPNGCIASGGDDGTVRIWDLANHAEPTVLNGHVGGVVAIAGLSDGRIVSAGHDSTVRVWDLENNNDPLTMTGDAGWVSAVVGLPDGGFASGGNDGTIRVWDPTPATAPRELNGHTGPVAALSLMPDGRILSGSHDSTVRVWSPPDRTEPPAREGHTDRVSAVIGLPDGRIASGSFDGTVQVWDISGGTEPVTLEGHTSWVLAIAVLPDGRLVSGSDDETVRVWDLTGTTEPLVLQGHWRAVCAVGTLPDARIVSAGRDDSVRLWDPSGHTIALQGHPLTTETIAVLPDGRFVTGSEDSTIQVWDLSNPAGSLTLEGHAGTVNAVTVLPDGRIASGSSDESVRVWDLLYHSDPQVLNIHGGGVNALAVLPNGHLVTGSRNGDVQVWDLDRHTTTTTVHTSDSVNAIATTAQHGKQTLVIALDSGLLAVDLEEANTLDPGRSGA